MAPKFGTSGLRGLVVELTPELVADHVASFLATCCDGEPLYIGEDLRLSSPEIAQVVAETAQAAGARVIRVGAVPTPALALAAQEAGASAVMITGSHIPADRNGLKFYTRAGEINKADEAAIVGNLGADRAAASSGSIEPDTSVGAAFVARYGAFFGAGALKGQTIGVYTHSAVGRDLLVEVLQALGATTVDLGRSDVFIPVDTEAVDVETREQLAGWIASHGLTAIVSTDGDSDRPMLTDEKGRVIPGDLLGQITAEMLGATHVVTPVSSNSSVAQKPCFETVLQTRIGSPYVIAGMEEAAQSAEARVAGYEANGGFLLGFAASRNGATLSPLATRDSFLPILAPLVAAAEAGQPLSSLAAAEAHVHTAANRLTDTPQEKSAAFVSDLTASEEVRAALLTDCGLGTETKLDLTDGVRITETSGAVIHIRPSGNAPELRVYVEAPTREGAGETLETALRVVADRIAAL